MDVNIIQSAETKSAQSHAKERRSKMKETFEQYGSTLREYGVYMTDMSQLQADVENGITEIILEKEMFKRLPSGRFPVKPYERSTETVSAEFYLNAISSIPFFKDRVKRSYTLYGHIPTELSCISWGTGDTKATRKFKFIKRGDING